MGDTQPLVSAVITTHNRAELLPRALDSAVMQTYENMEIVVVDDGSTDQTPQIIDEYEGSRPLKYIRNETAEGACRARNKGIKAAGGEFVAGLDDDDKWHEERIEKLMSAHSDRYACVTSDVLMVFARGQKVWKKRQVIDLDTLLYTNQVGNQVLVRRDRILEVGGFDPNLQAAQDYDLWIRLCEQYGPILNVQQSLQTIYMDHAEGRITDRSSFKGYLQFYEKHKHRFDRAQRKYQLFNIRRAEQKPLGFWEFWGWVPPFRYWDEFKQVIARRLWK